MNTPQFQQLKHRINFGQTPDIAGETFTIEQVNELRWLLRFKPEYLAVIIAQQEGTEPKTEEVSNIITQLLNDVITDTQIAEQADKVVETPTEEIVQTKKTKASKK